MARLTILSDAATTVEGRLEGDSVLIAESDLEAAIGWELKPEGLCQGDVCVPVRDGDPRREGGLVDLTVIADWLDRPIAIDADTATVAVGVPRVDRRQALTNLQAPAFTLPDLDGRMHSFDEWRGQKRLLVAFASW